MKQLLIVIIALAIMGGGVYWWINQAKSTSKTPSAVTAPVGGTPSANQKSGTTTKTGKLTGSAGKFYFSQNGETPQEIDSYSVDLSAYVNQTVTISGQYSGDTLFVGSVE